MLSLSSLAFGSYLTYSPHGTAPAELASAEVCRQIKRDGLLGRGLPAIPYVVRRVRLTLGLAPALAELLAAGPVLVPMPGCEPLPARRPGAVWVPRRICQELLLMRLGSRMEPLLQRRQPVAKSALARRGRRPGVREQYESLAVAARAAERAAAVTHILLVDDVVTRGATLLAGACRLAEAFPQADVRAFALVRTQFATGHPRGRQTFRSLVDPVVSRLTLDRLGRVWRRDR